MRSAPVPGHVGDRRRPPSARLAVDQIGAVDLAAGDLATLATARPAEPQRTRSPRRPTSRPGSRRGRAGRSRTPSSLEPERLADADGRARTSRGSPAPAGTTSRARHPLTISAAWAIVSSIPTAWPPARNEQIDGAQASDAQPTVAARRSAAARRPPARPAAAGRVRRAAGQRSAKATDPVRAGQAMGDDPDGEGDDEQPDDRRPDEHRAGHDAADAGGRRRRRRRS